MKITKRQLRQIIKEEARRLNEQEGSSPTVEREVTFKIKKTGDQMEVEMYLDDGSAPASISDWSLPEEISQNPRALDLGYILDNATEGVAGGYLIFDRPVESEKEGTSPRRRRREG
jgi:hypothetical protein